MTDNVKRLHAFLDATPGAAVDHVADTPSGTGYWTGTVDGQRLLSRDLGRLLDLMAPAAVTARACDELRLKQKWGDVYDISFSVLWRARQRGGDGRRFAAATADGLDGQLRRDWEQRGRRR